MIDGMPSTVFSADTLPPPELEHDDERRERILKVCRQRYARPRDQVEEKILTWMNSGREKKEEKTGSKEQGTRNKEQGAANKKQATEGNSQVANGNTEAKKDNKQGAANKNMGADNKEYRTANSEQKAQNKEKAAESNRQPAAGNRKAPSGDNKQNHATGNADQGSASNSQFKSGNQQAGAKSETAKPNVRRESASTEKKHRSHANANPEKTTNAKAEDESPAVTGLSEKPLVKHPKKDNRPNQKPPRTEHITQRNSGNKPPQKPANAPSHNKRISDANPVKPLSSRPKPAAEKREKIKQPDSPTPEKELQKQPAPSV